MKTRLRIAREAAKMTQAQMAVKTDMALRSYLYYESGERIPDAYAAQRIAQALNSTVDKIFPLPQRQLREQQSQPDNNQADDAM